MQLGYCVFRSFILRLLQLMFSRAFVASFVDRAVDWQHIGHTHMGRETLQYSMHLAVDFVVVVVFALRIGSC